MNTTSLLADFTVAIPTYNGAKRIPDVLERLKWQLGTEKFCWEILVVDNNSSDHTAAVVRHYQSQIPNLRYTFEGKQGAGFARQRAIRLARSPLIGFLDDDNLPSLTWVNRAYKFAQQHPQAAAIGSRLAGDFEAAPPQGFQRVAAFLALTDRGDRPLLYTPQQKILPPGAGLVVRRQAWLDTVASTAPLGIRIRNRDVAEDLEPVIEMQKAGWEIWYNPAMRLTHKISRDRLEKEYLVSLMRGIGLSRFRTRMLSFARWQRPLVVWLYIGNDLRKIVQHLLKFGPKAWTETIPASELALYCYSLWSPLFWLGSKLHSCFGRFFKPDGNSTPAIKSF
jgi:glycosyltransferase involved in cell wall biosynthesis